MRQNIQIFTGTKMAEKFSYFHTVWQLVPQRRSGTLILCENKFEYFAFFEFWTFGNFNNLSVEFSSKTKVQSLKSGQNCSFRLPNCQIWFHVKSEWQHFSYHSFLREVDTRLFPKRAKIDKSSMNHAWETSKLLALFPQNDMGFALYFVSSHRHILALFSFLSFRTSTQNRIRNGNTGWVMRHNLLGVGKPEI